MIKKEEKVTGTPNSKTQVTAWLVCHMIFKVRMSVTLAQIPKSHTALGFMITSNMHTRKQ